jgi:hypothetical protein
MFDVVNNKWLFAPGGHEDLARLIVIAVGALIERTLRALSLVDPAFGSRSISMAMSNQQSIV